ncbi:SurA N-terminal domain-containing protein [Streptomyces boninensis]|uniref:SurA N-terminal domain-containing protein n=1 Tax=Streptomyces boninensis TaxID=2039455 RepID=UPI003B2191B7
MRKARPFLKPRYALAATAGLLAVPLLAACGGEEHPGAAAVLQNDRITMSQLQAHVGAVRDAQRAQPQADEIIKQTGQLNRSALNSMIFDRVAAKAASNAGVKVSNGELQSFHDRMVQQAGGQKAFETGLVQQYGVAPGKQTDDFIRIQVLGDKLTRALGVRPGTPEAQPKLMAALAEASKQLKIDVNPRYGSWNDTKVQLDGTKLSWVKQVTGGGKGTAQS